MLLRHVSFILCLPIGKVNDVSLFNMYVSFIYFGVGDSECIDDSCMLNVGVAIGCVGWVCWLCVVVYVS